MNADRSEKWRYGRYLPEFGGPGSSFAGSSREGCINMLGHDMAAMHHGEGSCTCGQYRKDRLKRYVSDERQCQPCRALAAAQAELETSQEVTYRDRVFYYRQETDQ